MRRGTGVLIGLMFGFGLAGASHLSGTIGTVMAVLAGLSGGWLFGAFPTALADRHRARRAARDFVERIERERGRGEKT